MSFGKEKGEASRGQEQLGWNQGNVKYKGVLGRKKLIDEYLFNHLLFSIQSKHLFCSMKHLGRSAWLIRDLGRRFLSSGYDEVRDLD